MPPKVKTNKEAIVHAAFKVAEREGVSAITAQRVSKGLKTSVAPIFREFHSIEALRTATVEKIHLFHRDFIQNYPPAHSEFLTYGLAYIDFAKKYPYLFESIMLPSKTQMDERLTGTLNFVLDSAGSESGLSLEKTKELFFHVWIYTHGVACLTYKGSLAITEEEERDLLVTAFAAFYRKISMGEAE